MLYDSANSRECRTQGTCVARVGQNVIGRQLQVHPVLSSWVSNAVAETTEFTNEIYALALGESPDELIADRLAVSLS